MSNIKNPNLYGLGFMAADTAGAMMQSSDDDLISGGGAFLQGASKGASLGMMTGNALVAGGAALVGGIGGVAMNSIQKKKLEEQRLAQLQETRNNELLGLSNVAYDQPDYFAMGGEMYGTIGMNDVSQYKGNSHENGGISINSITEVEGNEIKFGDYIFSDRIKKGDAIRTARKALNEYKCGGKMKYADGGTLEGGNNPIEGDIISKVIMERNKDKDFVKRAYAVGEYPNSNMFTSETGENRTNPYINRESHRMAWGEDDKGQAYMFPTIYNTANEAIMIPNQYADYITEKGYKDATKMAMGGTLNNDKKKIENQNSNQIENNSQTNKGSLYRPIIESKTISSNIVCPDGVSGCSQYANRRTQKEYGKGFDYNTISNDAWYKDDHIVDYGGIAIYRPNNWDNYDNAKYLNTFNWDDFSNNYKNFQVGDQVGFSRGSYDKVDLEQTAGKGKYKNSGIEHSGVIVGFNEDGIPLVEHSHKGSGEAWVTPINAVEIGVYNYVPATVSRSKQFVNYDINNKKNDIGLTMKDYVIPTYSSGYKDVDDVINKQKKEVAYRYGINTNDINKFYDLAIGIGIQESDLGNRTPVDNSSISSFIKDSLSRDWYNFKEANPLGLVNISKAIKNKNEEITPEEAKANKEYNKKNGLKPLASPLRREMEAIKYSEKNKIPINEAIEIINSRYGKLKNPNNSSELKNQRSRGTFQTKIVSNLAKDNFYLSSPSNIGRWKESTRADYNLDNEFKNVIGIIKENYDALKEKYKDYNEEDLLKVVALAHNSPLYAYDKELMDFYIRDKKGNIEYVDNIFSHIKNLKNK